MSSKSSIPDSSVIIIKLATVEGEVREPSTEKVAIDKAELAIAKRSKKKRRGANKRYLKQKLVLKAIPLPKIAIVKPTTKAERDYEAIYADVEEEYDPTEAVRRRQAAEDKEKLEEWRQAMHRYLDAWSPTASITTWLPPTPPTPTQVILLPQQFQLLQQQVQGRAASPGPSAAMADPSDFSATRFSLRPWKTRYDMYKDSITHDTVQRACQTVTLTVTSEEYVEYLYKLATKTPQPYYLLSLPLRNIISETFVETREQHTFTLPEIIAHIKNYLMNKGIWGTGRFINILNTPLADILHRTDVRFSEIPVFIHQFIYRIRNLGIPGLSSSDSPKLRYKKANSARRPILPNNCPHCQSNRFQQQLVNTFTCDMCMRKFIVA
jgi:hypothetical protein